MLDDEFRLISVGRLSQMSSQDVTRMVNARYGEEEITDACAVTIAAQWQSPGRSGEALAELASTGHTDLSRLLDNIADARLSVTNDWDRKALDMLATWAIDACRPVAGEVNNA